MHEKILILVVALVVAIGAFYIALSPSNSEIKAEMAKRDSIQTEHKDTVNDLFK
ncbi:hypothetical protein [Olivibacter sp. 47]|uniref:hypothetical protein n=1 Tax=Olivibacter sp. 47 TaxID=3056486 RepID=UPI0025A42B1E|nr:hypothetical protein [Olivibacter sp. 47]